MTRKRMVLVLAALLVLTTAVALGASQTMQTQVPPAAIVESPNARANPGQPRPTVYPAPGLPDASAPVEYYTDFGKGLDGWQSLPSAQARWEVTQGRLVQAGDTSGDIADEDAVLIISGVTFKDGTIEAHVYPTSGAPVGLVFRGSDAGYYRLTLFNDVPNDSPKALLQKVTPEGIRDIASVPVTSFAGLTLARWQHISVTANGTHITVSVEGRPLIEASDPSFSAGWAGVWTYADMGAQFDNVRIQRQSAGR